MVSRSYINVEHLVVLALYFNPNQCFRSIYNHVGGALAGEGEDGARGSRRGGLECRDKRRGMACRRIYMKRKLERRQQRLTLPLDVGRCGDTICCQLVTTCVVAAACEQLRRGGRCITTVPPQFDYVPFFHPGIVSLGGCVFTE